MSITPTKNLAYAILLTTFFFSPLSASDNPDYQRAGIVILQKTANNQVVTYVGEKSGAKNEWRCVMPAAGQKDLKDSNDPRRTALREGKEETGGPYSPFASLTINDLNPNYSIKANLSNGATTLYFIWMNGNASSQTLTTAVRSACSLGSPYNEVSAYHAIDLNTFVNTVYKCSSQKNLAENRRFLSVNGQQLQFERNYMDAFIQQRGDMCKKLEQMTGNNYQPGANTQSPHNPGMNIKQITVSNHQPTISMQGCFIPNTQQDKVNLKVMLIKHYGESPDDFAVLLRENSDHTYSFPAINIVCSLENRLAEVKKFLKATYNIMDTNKIDGCPIQNLNLYLLRNDNISIRETAGLDCALPLPQLWRALEELNNGNTNVTLKSRTKMTPILINLNFLMSLASNLEFLKLHLTIQGIKIDW